MAHEKTPDGIVEKYARDMIKVMFTREVEDRASLQPFKISPKGVAEFSTFLQSEVSRWNRIIKAAKITAI